LRRQCWLPMTGEGSKTPRTNCKRASRILGSSEGDDALASSWCILTDATKFSPVSAYACRYTVASRFWCQRLHLWGRSAVSNKHLNSSFQVTACDGTHGLIEFLPTIIAAAFQVALRDCRHRRNGPVVNAVPDHPSNKAPSLHPQRRSH